MSSEKVEKRICQNCKKEFVIEKEDFNFYEKMKVPAPTFCPDCRYERRIDNRLKISLYERFCMCEGKTDNAKIYRNTIKHFHGDEPCVEKFKTGYNPDSKDIVYCEKCYQQEVY